MHKKQVTKLAYQKLKTILVTDNPITDVCKGISVEVNQVTDIEKIHSTIVTPIPIKFDTELAAHTKCNPVKSIENLLLGRLQVKSSDKYFWPSSEYSFRNENNNPGDFLLGVLTKTAKSQVAFAEKLSTIKFKNSIRNAKCMLKYYSGIRLQPYTLTKMPFSSENKTTEVYPKEYNEALLKAFGKVFEDHENTYDLLQEKSHLVYSNFSPAQYFQNRPDVVKEISKQLEVNMSSRFNSTTVENNINIKLITLNQNNGTGKTSLLKMLQYLVPNIIVNNKDRKVLYPSIVSRFSFKTSVANTFAKRVLEGIKEKIFYGYKIKIKNIVFNEDDLTHISKNLTTYLDNKDFNESKSAWELLLKDYFDIEEIVSYRPPHEDSVIIFRIDEIGSIIDGLKESEELTDFGRKFFNVGFEKAEAVKIQRLYDLRNYIHAFSTGRIDVILVGKNGFFAFMGKMSFSESPCNFLNVNLKPLNLNSKYLERIVQYLLLSKSEETHSFKKYLLKLKKENANKESFNAMMNIFYKLLGTYSGGHPRLIEAILATLENATNLEKYFDSKKEINKMEESINSYFQDIQLPLFKKNEAIFDRFGKASLINTILRIAKKEKSPLSDKNLLFYLHLIHRNSQTLSKFLLRQLLDILKSKFDNVFGDNEIRLSEREILDSIGLPYDIKDDETTGVEVYKVQFPKYLVNYIYHTNNFTFETIRDVLKFTFSIPISLSPEQMQDILCYYEYHCLRLYALEEFGEIFKSENNNPSYRSVELIEIDGHTQEEGYSETIYQQINSIAGIADPTTVFVILPKDFRNFATDHYLVIPIESKKLLLSRQVKTKLNNTLKLEVSSDYLKKGFETNFNICAKLTESKCVKFESYYSILTNAKEHNVDNVSKIAKDSIVKKLSIQKQDIHISYHTNTFLIELTNKNNLDSKNKVTIGKNII